MRVGTAAISGGQPDGERWQMKIPPGNLAVLRDIPAMGTMFTTAAQSGPQATTPLVTEPYQGTVYFRFEPVVMSEN